MEMSWLEGVKNTLFSTVNYLDNPVLLLTAACCFYWIWHKEFGRDLMVLLMGSLMLNQVIKVALNLAPSTLESLIPLSNQTVMGSANMQVVALFWTMLAMQMRNRNMWYTTMAIILTTALSRMNAGHDGMLDALVGTAIGFATTFLYQWVSTTTIYRKLDGNFLNMLPICIAFVAAMFILTKNQDAYMPWMLASSALLISFVLAVVVDQKTTSFESPSNMITKILCVALGLVSFMFAREFFVNAASWVSADVSLQTALVKTMVSLYMVWLFPTVFTTISKNFSQKKVRYS